MDSDTDEARILMLSLLKVTRRETRLALFGIDSERVVHDDTRAWRVRDVVGHLGVWNGEAARSLRAYAEGASTTASGQRRNMMSTMAQWRMNGAPGPWSRCGPSTRHQEINSNGLAETMPVEKWTGKMLYPWNERGTIRNLIEVMMKHEVDHRQIIVKAIS